MTLARIRPAHGGDAEVIHHLLLDTWQEAYATHLPEEAFEKLSATGKEHWEQELIQPEGIWIAHRDGHVVGMSRAIAAGPGQARALELDKLYVRQTEYGTETARNLLHIATGDAPCQTWVANYNERAQKFYQKMGFAPDGSPAKETNYPDVTLHRWVR